MKRIVLLLCMLCFSVPYCKAETEYAEVLRQMNSLPTVVPFSDGSFALLGTSLARNNQIPDALCVAMDHAGHVLWRASYPADDDLVSFQMCCETGSSGKALLLHEECNGNYLGKYRLLMLNKESEYRQIEIVPGDLAIEPMIFPSSDGCFLFMGEEARHSTDPNQHDDFHITSMSRLTREGVVSWAHTFDDMEVRLCDSVSLRNGNTVFCGRMSAAPYERDTKTIGILLCFDPYGKLMWSASSKNQEIDEYLDVALCPGAERILTIGHSQRVGAQTVVESYDTAGNVLYARNDSAVQGSERIYVIGSKMALVRLVWSDDVRVYIDMITPELQMTARSAVFSCSAKSLASVWISHDAHENLSLGIILCNDSGHGHDIRILEGVLFPSTIS